MVKFFSTCRITQTGKYELLNDCRKVSKIEFEKGEKLLRLPFRLKSKEMAKMTLLAILIDQR